MSLGLAQVISAATRGFWALSNNFRPYTSCGFSASNNCKLVAIKLSRAAGVLLRAQQSRLFVRTRDGVGKAWLRMLGGVIDLKISAE